MRVPELGAPSYIVVNYRVLQQVVTHAASVVRAARRTGTWMQSVGAQWLLVDASTAAVRVSLVQAATTLPVMLFALPAGCWPTPLIGVGCCFRSRRTSSSLDVLAVLTALGQMLPALLIVFTFLFGVGAAVQLPSWASQVSSPPCSSGCRRPATSIHSQRPPLDRPTAGLRYPTRHRAGAGRRPLHRRGRAAGGLSGGDDQAPPVPPPDRGRPAGSSTVTVNVRTGSSKSSAQLPGRNTGSTKAG